MKTGGKKREGEPILRKCRAEKRAIRPVVSFLLRIEPFRDGGHSNGSEEIILFLLGAVYGLPQTGQRAFLTCPGRERVRTLERRVLSELS